MYWYVCPSMVLSIYLKYWYLKVVLGWSGPTHVLWFLCFLSLKSIASSMSVPYHTLILPFISGWSACPAGTYKDRPGPGDIASCLPCPDPNMMSVPGSSSVHQCYCKGGYNQVGLQCQSKLPPWFKVHTVLFKCSDNPNTIWQTFVYYIVILSIYLLTYTV